MSKPPVQEREVEGGGSRSPSTSKRLTGFTGTAWYQAQHAHFGDNYRVMRKNLSSDFQLPKQADWLRSSQKLKSAWQ